MKLTRAKTKWCVTCNFSFIDLRSEKMSFHRKAYKRAYSKICSKNIGAVDLNDIRFDQIL